MFFVTQLTVDLACLWGLIPLCNVYNFAVCPILPVVRAGQGMTAAQLIKTKRFRLFILLMICAGACELSMAQWASAFVESALGLPKTVGDLHTGILASIGFPLCLVICVLLIARSDKRAAK